jgi:regulator of replication initiation timing
MFNRHLKARIETLEHELVRFKAELGEVRQILPRVLTENHFLRQESDQLRGFDITPAFPV